MAMVWAEEAMAVAWAFESHAAAILESLSWLHADLMTGRADDIFAQRRRGGGCGGCGARGGCGVCEAPGRGRRRDGGRGGSRGGRLGGRGGGGA
eukprot:9757966-Alexandrium_andersonii.AAC.1